MKGKIFAVIFILNFASIMSLNAQWARTYGTSEDDYVYSMQPTSDGGYIISGNTMILKLDSGGNIEWQTNYGDSFAKQTSDGGFIIGRTIEESSNNQIWLIKLATNGDIIWQKNYWEISTNYSWPAQNQFHQRIRSLQQTSDGGYVVTGRSGPDDLGDYNIFIMKISFDGTFEWLKIYGGSEKEDAYSIQQTFDDGYIIAGETESVLSGSSDNWILKLRSDGSIEWQKGYGGTEHEVPYSVQQTKDGGYITAGTITSFGAGLTDFWILKLTSSGEIEWNKTFGGDKKDEALSIQQTFDGGYIVGGKTESFGFGSFDIWILKLTIEGEIEWQKTYGGSRLEEGFVIEQTYDGGYVVSGSTDTYGVGDLDYLILKLFSNGDINSSCVFIKESDAEVFDTNIKPVNTYIKTESLEILFADLNITPEESLVIDYSLCSGQQTLILSTSFGGITVPLPGTYVYDYAEKIPILAKPDDGYYFIGWSGDILSIDDSFYITMDSDKSVIANFSDKAIEEELEEVWEEVKKAPCFIATAAFGSPLHPYVKVLQDFRDKYLMTSRLGREFINLYYRYSPPIADFIKNHKALRTVVRIWLVPIVAFGYSMVLFGPGRTTLIIALTIMPLFFFGWCLRRKRNP